ncbi:tetratricopeptide repeat protein [Desulfovibrio aerotolerans]|uniref:Tetratricopeptide repeat protein n=1 Tax=Solidesulfovibrio aerotolerans TaxID=295255 RepID=A0A7C9MWU3_9BACT|nr:tetratricopeptide repeat protein [Solidesulfovibrio aerotolerans]MYL84714.1 tetratricopeptide repeat protein [Solidesulfovibrio aerotolerans]
MPALPEILGCYQSHKREKMGGKGSKGREFTQRIDWLALRLDPDRILTFPLDEKHLPLPLQKIVAADEFLLHYLPAPLLFTERLAPAAVVLVRLLRDVGPGLDHKTLPAAEQALFVVVLTALAVAGLPDTGNEALKVLSTAGGGMAAQAQAISINAFGISLRKRGDFDAAAAFYRKALELAPTDERLMFNLARALYEKGDAPACSQLLEQALAAAPDFAEAKAFLRWLKRRTPVPGDDDFPDITI